MKRYMIAAAVLATVFCIGCGSEPPVEEVSKQSIETVEKAAAPAPQASGKYGIKSGVIHFEGSDFNGTHKEIVYFDDYGRKERLERYDADGALAEIKLCDGSKLYSISDEEQTAYILSDYASRGTEMQFKPSDWTDRHKEKYQYRDEPDMTIAGKKCTAFSSVTSVGKTTYAGWSNITLFYNIESKYGTITKKASRLEENVSLPSAKFTIPENYAVQKVSY